MTSPAARLGSSLTVALLLHALALAWLTAGRDGRTSPRVKPSAALDWVGDTPIDRAVVPVSLPSARLAMDWALGSTDSLPDRTPLAVARPRGLPRGRLLVSEIGHAADQAHEAQRRADAPAAYLRALAAAVPTFTADIALAPANLELAAIAGAIPVREVRETAAQPLVASRNDNEATVPSPTVSPRPRVTATPAAPRPTPSKRTSSAPSTPVPKPEPAMAAAIEPSPRAVESPLATLLPGPTLLVEPPVAVAAPELIPPSTSVPSPRPEPASLAKAEGVTPEIYPPDLGADVPEPMAPAASAPTPIPPDNEPLPHWVTRPPEDTMVRAANAAEALIPGLVTAPDRGPGTWSANRNMFFSRLTAHLFKANQEALANAVRAGPKLTLDVRFHVARDGRVLSASVVRSSGLPDLDRKAEETILNASPLPRLSEDMPQQQLELSFPVEVYR